MENGEKTKTIKQINFLSVESEWILSGGFKIPRLSSFWAFSEK